MAMVRWAVRCHATAKSTGQTCRRYAIAGSWVCWVHGGAIGHVRAAADRRLLAWKAARRMQRTVGRPLNEFELSRITGDDTGWRRQVNALLAEIRADEATVDT
jgi:hypothetical protein